MRIRITGPALADPGRRIAPERLLDFVGCTLEADDQAVMVFRSLHPTLPNHPDTHAVAIGDVLEALALRPAVHPEAIPTWGALIESCLVYFPADSVESDTISKESVMDTIYVLIYQVPKKGIPPELAKKLLGLVVPVWGYLLIGTKEPLHPWEDATAYSVCNDDLREALVSHYGPNVAETLYPFLPVGQVTRVPVDCCETRPCPPTTQGDPP